MLKGTNRTPGLSQYIMTDATNDTNFVNDIQDLPASKLGTKE